jgi:hypothetical protein
MPMTDKKRRIHLTHSAEVDGDEPMPRNLAFSLILLKRILLKRVVLGEPMGPIEGSVFGVPHQRRLEVFWGVDVA